MNQQHTSNAILHYPLSSFRLSASGRSKCPRTPLLPLLRLFLEFPARGHCIITSCRKWLLLTHPITLGHVSRTQSMTQPIVHEMGMGATKETSKTHFKFFSKFYIKCEVEFDNLGLKYIEC